MFITSAHFLPILREIPKRGKTSRRYNDEHVVDKLLEICPHEIRHTIITLVSDEQRIGCVRFWHQCPGKR